MPQPERDGGAICRRRCPLHRAVPGRLDGGMPAAGSRSVFLNGSCTPYEFPGGAGGRSLSVVYDAIAHSAGSATSPFTRTTWRTR